jgi:hypothetical protein
MKKINKYVDKLFYGYKLNKKTQDLKDEIVSNLEDKVKDYINRGMSQNEAEALAIKDLDNIDGLVDVNQRIYINGFINELLQISTLYTVICWIITLPLRLSLRGILLNSFILFLLIIISMFYIIRLRKKEDSFINEASVVDTQKMNRIKKITWILWLLFIIVATLFTTSLNFGSNLWFSRSITINGPYEFAVLAVRYCTPLITIFIPLLANKSCKLIDKYEVKN